MTIAPPHVDGTIVQCHACRKRIGHLLPTGVFVHRHQGAELRLLAGCAHVVCHFCGALTEILIETSKES